MCVVSMVMDHYADKWGRLLKQSPAPAYPYLPPGPWTPTPVPFPPPGVTFDEATDFRRLYERAKDYDVKTGQPDCELESKKALVKELAAKLGLNVNFLDEPGGET